MSQSIEVIVDAKGQTRLETKGFSGQECQEASRALELALGLKQSDVRTTEYYLPAQSGQQQQITGD